MFTCNPEACLIIVHTDMFYQFCTLFLIYVPYTGKFNLQHEDSNQDLICLYQRVWQGSGMLPIHVNYKGLHQGETLPTKCMTACSNLTSLLKGHFSSKHKLHCHLVSFSPCDSFAKKTH